MEINIGIDKIRGRIITSQSTDYPQNTIKLSLYYY